MGDFKKIKTGLSILFERDAYLLINDLSERSITHKLGEYYQILFPKWNVDCEYNKNLGDPKEISINPKALLRQMAIYLEKKIGKKECLAYDNYISLDFIPSLTKQLKDPKIEYINELNIYLFNLKLISGEIVRKTIYPDIIVHQRGKRNNNIVFEVKKSNNNSRDSRLYDFVKLATLVSSAEYAYKKGIFIDLPMKNNFDIFQKFKREKTCFSGVYKYLPEYKNSKN